MPAKLDRCVRQVIKKKTDEYREKYARSPGEAQQKKIKNSAWAICTKVGKEQGWI